MIVFQITQEIEMEIDYRSDILIYLIAVWMSWEIFYQEVLSETEVKIKSLALSPAKQIGKC